MPAARRHRLPGRALSRRAADADPGDRRRARHRRSPADRRRSRPRPANARWGLSTVRALGTVPASHGPPAWRSPRRRHQPLGSRTELPTYLYDAQHAAPARDAAALRVREGRGGLRLHLRVLHHPAPARALPSRPADEIVREARALAARGVKELLLISQDTTFYGNDLGERGALGRLLRQLNAWTASSGSACSTSTRRPSTTTMLDAMADCEKVCKYIDLPLQHASDAVLKRMRRPGTRASYERLLDRIRTRMPGRRAAHHLHRRLPGRDRGRLRRALGIRRSAVQFDHVGVFTYSHEEGTRAGSGTTTCRRRSKSKRRDRLMAQQRTIVAAAQQRAGRQPRPVGRGRPVARARTGPARTAGVSGARNRPRRLPHRLRPVTEVSAGQFLDGEVVGARGLRLGRPPLMPPRLC